MAEKTNSQGEPAVEQQQAPVVEPAKKSNKTLWIVLGLVFVFLFVIPGILLTAGGLFLKNKIDDPNTGEKLAESLIEKASGGEVDIESDGSGGFTAKSKDGSSSVGIGGDQELPSDFPKSTASFLNEKKVIFVLASENEGKKSWTVTTTVNESYDEANAYFEKAINDTDYTEVSSYGIGSTKSFSGTKDGKIVLVTVGQSNDEGTTVNYLVTEE